MSENVNMSLDDSISKRKTTEPRGERGGFRGRRGGRRGDSSRPFRRGDRKPFSKFGRGGRFKREGGERRERTDKFKADRQARRPISKLGLKGKFIRRTGLGRTRDEPRPAQSERRVERRVERERPLTEKRRLRVSNLDFNITHKDLMELFSKLGSLTKNKIEYDDLGRSKGTALIEYEKHDSAVKAMQEYDGAVLDGRTITVEFDDDAKKRSGGESGVLRKTITKDYGYRDRGDRREDRRDDRREERRGGRRFDDDDRGFRKPFRRDGFRGRGGRGRGRRGGFRD